MVMTSIGSDLMQEVMLRPRVKIDSENLYQTIVDTLMGNSSKQSPTLKGNISFNENPGKSPIPIPGIPNSPWDDLIYEKGQSFGIDPIKAKKHIWQESMFNPRAVNLNTNARGLGQFTDAGLEQYGNFDPFDPVASIGMVFRTLSDNYKRFGDWKKAYAAYNLGPTAVAAGKPYPEETVNHLKKVFGE